MRAAALAHPFATDPDSAARATRTSQRRGEPERGCPAQPRLETPPPLRRERRGLPREPRRPHGAGPALPGSRCRSDPRLPRASPPLSLSGTRGPSCPARSSRAPQPRAHLAESATPSRSPATSAAPAGWDRDVPPGAAPQVSSGRVGEIPREGPVPSPSPGAAAAPRGRAPPPVLPLSAGRSGTFNSHCTT